MRYRLQRHDGTDCSATMVPFTVLRLVPIQRYCHFRVSIDNNILKFNRSIRGNRIVVHRSLAEQLYLCLRYALHVSAKIQPEDPA